MTTSSKGNPKSNGAFTLLEILLAMSIAIGLFLVALHFYQHATDLRAQLIQESERLSTIRQVMDRMSTDLRAAFAQSPQGFMGDSNSLRFVTTHFPSRLAWSFGAADPAAVRETDLKLIRYEVARGTEGTNLVAKGFSRTEHMLAEVKPAVTKSLLTNNISAAMTMTNLVAEPITDAIRFLRFRFWDGSAWTDSWIGSSHPIGVEVTLATDALPEAEHPDDYSGEIFRRVIYLPSGSPSIGDFELARRLSQPSKLTANVP
ncbi:MAG: hypothetical protein EXS31_00340 [Pedosphaera sp.]|nr:hypothetical protein [Pedosphaera sp.]